MKQPKFTPQPWHVRFLAGPETRTEAGDAATYRLIAAAPKLYALARQYAGECGECAGAGRYPDGDPCEECLFVRKILDEIDGKAAAS